MPIISCVEEGGSNASSSALGKGKVLCEGQPGVAEDTAFPNFAGVKWSKMGFRLHLGDTGLTDEHGERTGSGWDGVKFPGSNHYRAVVFTCSYNSVDSTPMFSSRQTGLMQHQGCSFILYLTASRLEVGKSVGAHIARTADSN